MPAPSGVTVTLLQINATVGDLSGNVHRMVEAVQRAYAAGARVAVTPELALSGYPPEDLLLRPAFLHACDAALADLAVRVADLPGMHVVVGHPRILEGKGDVRTRSWAMPGCLNAASVLAAGQVLATYVKRELPNYQVFDERRYFASGRDAGLPPVVFEVGGVRFAVNICEDAWYEEPARVARQAGGQVLLVLNASPFHLGKLEEREQRMVRRASDCGMAVLYAHLTGGQDELVFDGASFAVDGNGVLAARAPFFEPADLTLQVDAQGRVQGPLAPVPGLEAQAWGALVTGVRDYVGKNRFPGAIIGLSGGIDSALVLAIAVDALGPDRVRAVMMPSRYTAEASWIDARDMAQRLGVRYDELPIEPMVGAFNAALATEFKGLPADATEENIQARIRGTLLMALSNKHRSIVLTTGNKSEMATGYCTLYGDMAGGFAVLKDVAKTLVYRLARWRNAQGDGPVIPDRIITRPPSAELRENQTDQDSLPPYEVLDAIMQRYMEEDQGIDEIKDAGFAPADVERVTHLLKVNEYKRRQAPVGIRITHRAFGRDWRYPITSGFRA